MSSPTGPRLALQLSEKQATRESLASALPGMPRPSAADRTTGLRRTTRSGSVGPPAAADDAGNQGPASGPAAKGRKAQGHAGSQALAVRTPSAQELRSTAVKHRVLAPRQASAQGKSAKRADSAHHCPSASEEEELLAESDSDADDDSAGQGCNVKVPAAAARRPPARKRAAAAPASRYRFEELQLVWFVSLAWRVSDEQNACALITTTYALSILAQAPQGGAEGESPRACRRAVGG